MIATPDRRLRVFVSSTLVELAAERAAARAAIERLHLTPVMFELGARPHPPRALYSAYVAQSDVFVGIYGESYGWVAPGSTTSGLEEEYRLAAGKPRLLYVKQPVAAREDRLTALLEAIEGEAAVSYRTFSGADELGRMLAEDLAVLLSERFQSVTGTEAPLFRTTFPASVDRFVGRAHELTALERHLVEPDTRLVTITGPGGVGKTRLALEAARRVHTRFADGAHAVALESVRDHRLVASTIKESLAIRGATSQPLDALVARLRSAELLLLVDNFEHLLAAAFVVERLLEGCPRLAVLVTSRAVLRLRGERDFPLAPLAVTRASAAPAPGTPPEAVELFLERARAADPSFELTTTTAAAVEGICRRLDGLPLAIELAAAHVRVLGPAAIAARLERQLDVSARGAGSYPARQQTLRATIAWSFALLDEQAQATFARASVFRGGWTLDAFEAVCGSGGDAVDLLTTLVENSLVAQRSIDGELRFTMLETIREFAGEQLELRGERSATLSRHALFFSRTLARVGKQLLAAEQGDALVLLDRDADNIRAALAHMRDGGDVERVAEAAWSLLPYWCLREHVAEGRRWIDDILEAPELSERARGRALAVGATLAFWGSDLGAAVRLAGEGLPRVQALGDDAAVALVEIPLGVAEAVQGTRETGIALIEDSLRRSHELGSEWGVAMSMLALGWALNAAEAEAGLEHYEETLARAAALGFEAETIALGALGRRYALLGDHENAKVVLAEALRRVLRLDARLGLGLYLDLLGDLASAEGSHALATRLSAAAEAAFASVAAPVTPLAGNRLARLEALRARLGSGPFEAEDRAGRESTLEEAVAEALAWAAASSP